jgi:tellurite resistance protein
MDDGIITNDEAAILHVLAGSLGVSPGDTAECLSVIRGEEKNPFDDVEEDYSGKHMGDVSTYQGALIAALDDEVISEDEWSMLDSLRSITGIQPDQHAMIEEAIHSMADIDSNGQKSLDRLNRFNIVCPYNH